MSDETKKPVWKNTNAVIDSIDWSSLNSWKNTYIWDKNVVTKSYIGSEISLYRTGNLDSSVHGIMICDEINTGITEDRPYIKDFVSYL